MKQFITTLLVGAALITPNVMLAHAKIDNVAEQNEALEFFVHNNLSQCVEKNAIPFGTPAKLPFHNDGMPTGNEEGIINPQGIHYPLSWNGHTWAVFQEVKFSGYCGEMVKSEDGKTAYFMNLLPDFQTYWVKGEIDTERNVVIIPNDQLVYEIGGNKYYLVAMPCTLDDYGYAQKPTGEEIVACDAAVEIPMTEDGGIDATGIFFWLWGYAHLNHDSDGNPLKNDAYMSFSYSMIGNVITEEIITAPEEAEEIPYFFKELDIYYGYDYADEIGYMGAVKMDGDDIYMRGLSSLSPKSYVKGTVMGSLILMPSNQVLTDGRFYYSFSGIYNIREEEVTNYGYTYMDWVFDDTPTAYFYVVDDTIALADGMGVVSDFYGSDGSRPYWYVNLTLEKFAGNKAATPYEPTQLSYSQWWDYGFADFTFMHTSQDVRTGEWINPRNCFYEVYFDDKPYTFTSDKHVLEEGDTEITQVPVLYKSKDFVPYDEFSMWQSEYITFTMHDKDMAWNRMKIRIGYTDDEGTTYYSNFADMKNPNGGTTSLGIAATESVCIDYYDLQGHRIAGIPSLSGVYVKVATNADGTKKASKILVK